MRKAPHAQPLRQLCHALLQIVARPPVLGHVPHVPLPQQHPPPPRLLRTCAPVLPLPALALHHTALLLYLHPLLQLSWHRHLSLLLP